VINLNVFSWNVNGIRAVEKKGFIDWLKSSNADILCIQETKANEDQLSDDLREIKGYKSFFNSAEKKGYSGTAVYYKKEPKKIWTGLSEERFNSEGRVIAMEYDDFILFNIYFPNGQMSDERLNFKMEFLDCFLKDVNDFVSKGKNVIVCGDYNIAHNEIDLKNPKANSKRSGFLPIEREWMDKYISNGYVDTFRFFYPEEVKYSWWSYKFKARENNAGWRIDYFFVSKNFIENISDPEIHNDVFGSDHCPVSIKINI
jgi:exodeoxyribonuclease-3